MIKALQEFIDIQKKRAKTPAATEDYPRSNPMDRPLEIAICTVDSLWNTAATYEDYVRAIDAALRQYAVEYLQAHSADLRKSERQRLLSFIEEELDSKIFQRLAQNLPK